MARLLIVWALLALTACSTPSGNRSAMEAFQQRQATAAAEAASEGRLREALSLWLTVTTVDPGNADAIAAIAAIRDSIDRDTQQAIGEGEAAYVQGRRREGDRWMLRALALSPGDPRALDALRKSSSDASHDRQKEKVKSAYAGRAEKMSTPEVTPEPGLDLEGLFEAGDYAALLRAADGARGPGLSDADLAWVRETHLALARRARDAKQPEEQLQHLDDALAITVTPDNGLQKERQALARELSDDYYRQSLGLFNSDLDAAIAALERAITFNPANIAATEKLDQAQILKRNLEKIQAR